MFADWKTYKLNSEALEKMHLRLSVLKSKHIFRIH